MPEREVGDWYRRQVEIQGFPVFTVVIRDKHTKFGARVKQAALCRVFADNTHECIPWQTPVNALPAFAIIRGLVNIRFEIVELVAGYCEVNRGLVMWTDFDGIDHGLARMIR